MPPPNAPRTWALARLADLWACVCAGFVALALAAAAVWGGAQAVPPALTPPPTTDPGLGFYVGRALERALVESLAAAPGTWLRLAAPAAPVLLVPAWVAAPPTGRWRLALVAAVWVALLAGVAVADRLTPFAYGPGLTGEPAVLACALAALSAAAAVTLRRAARRGGAPAQVSAGDV